MKGRIELMLAVLLLAVGMFRCTSEPPEPLFVGGETDGDGDTDADADGDADDGPSCDEEEYPCGPYGHQMCDTIEDLRFIPANEWAEEMAGSDGLLSLSDIYADESVLGILLFGTAGWCSACATEARDLNALSEELQDVDGQGGRIEIVTVVFQDESALPATKDYAERYNDRYDFDFPAVADTSGDVLYYFDAQSSPGNIMIDATEMRIQRVVQGYDRASIEATLWQLDGSVRCP
jgi:peroxiredoxin